MYKKYITDTEYVDEWDYVKNNLDPKRVLFSSNKKFWWVCKLSHSYLMSANKRSIGRSCFYCSGKRVLSGFNDLWTTHPELSQNLVDPWLGFILSKGSTKKVSWYCSKDHVWESTPNYRTTYSGSGCPYCSGRLPIVGKTDLWTTDPEISKYLVDQTEGFRYTRGSGKRLKFRCNNKHEFSRRICSIGPVFECYTCTKKTAGSRPEKLIWARFPSLESQKKIFVNGKNIKVDFYDKYTNTVIEYDGAWWHSGEVVEIDTAKTKGLLDLGYKVIRIRETSERYSIELDIESENLEQILVKYAYDLRHMDNVIHRLEQVISNDYNCND